jgi:hypothetical protein
MSGSGDICVDEGPKDKMKRKVTSLLETVEVLGKLDRGTTIAAVRCCYGVNESIISLLKKN